VSEARSFGELPGASITQPCQTQPLAVCVKSTAVLKRASSVDCFATTTGCDAYRSSMLASPDFADVSTCEPAPTSWLVRGSDASPF
jgi:hypothetical protein